MYIIHYELPHKKKSKTAYVPAETPYQAVSILCGILIGDYVDIKHVMTQGIIH